MDAEIRPHVSKEYTAAQSRFAHVPQLPMRAIVVAPSGGGKTTLLVSLILDIYKGCWKRIHIFSQTALLDDAWKPVAKYCKEVLGQEEDCLHDTFDEAAVQDRAVGAPPQDHEDVQGAGYDEAIRKSHHRGRPCG